MSKTIEGWQVEDWDKMQKALQSLSLEELRTIAKNGNINFIDDSKANKQDYILILDELGPSRLNKEYNSILSKRE